MKDLDLIYVTARELPPEERSAYLTKACGGDLRLRTRVEQMLAVADDAEAFITDLPEAESEERKAEGETLADLKIETADFSDAVIGQKIGRYKILEKDRTRRYETANGLAADIKRHLTSEPVLARPPSKLYELQRLVRRHKLGFAATGAILLALAAGVVVSAWQAVRARQAEKLAKERLVEVGKEKDAKELARRAGWACIAKRSCSRKKCATMTWRRWARSTPTP